MKTLVNVNSYNRLKLLGKKKVFIIVVSIFQNVFKNVRLSKYQKIIRNNVTFIGCQTVITIFEIKGTNEVHGCTKVVTSYRNHAYFPPFHFLILSQRYLNLIFLKQENGSGY